MKPHTRLSGKEYSPMVIRRVSMPFLHWVAIITDDNLDSLDDVIQQFWKDENTNPREHTIQTIRNMCGELCERMACTYEKTEGAAVIFSADKMLVSSLAGDFMVHEQCRLELYQLLNLSTQV